MSFNILTGKKFSIVYDKKYHRMIMSKMIIKQEHEMIIQKIKHLWFVTIK